MLKKYLPNANISISNTLVKRQGDPKQPQTPDFLVRDFPGFTIETTYAMEWPGMDFDKSSLKNISIDSGPIKNYCKILKE